MIQKLLLGLSFIAVLCVTTSCQYLKFERYRHKYSQYQRQSESKAIIHPLEKKNIGGWVHFKHVKKKGKKQTALVTAKITGLEPNKKYGFHVHEYGDCSEQGQYVGKHYNPHYTRHGLPGDEQRHLGDMGNLSAGADGTAFYNKLLSMCMWGTVGRSIVIHAKIDDGQSQPSGNAGPYIACGVIGYTSSAEEGDILEDESELIWEDEKQAKKASHVTVKESESSKPATNQQQAHPQQITPKPPVFTSSPPSTESPKPAVLKVAPTTSAPASKKAVLPKEVKSKEVKSKAVPPKAVKSKAVPPKAVKSKAVPSKAVKSKAVPPKAVKSKAVPPKAVKSKAVPPKEVKSKAVPPKAVKSKAVPPKAVKSKAVPPKAVKSKAVPPKEVKSKAVKPKAVAEPTAASPKTMELKTSAVPDPVPPKSTVTPSPSGKKGAVPSSSTIETNKKAK